MILCFRVANFTRRPHNALGGIMYFETSSKLKRMRADESARLRGEGARGRASRRASGRDIVLGALELVESSPDRGVGELFAGENSELADAFGAPESGVAMRPSGT